MGESLWLKWLIEIVVSEFKHQPRNYVHFWTNTRCKCMNPLSFQLWWLNGTFTFLKMALALNNPRRLISYEVTNQLQEEIDNDAFPNVIYSINLCNLFACTYLMTSPQNMIQRSQGKGKNKLMPFSRRFVKYKQPRSRFGSLILVPKKITEMSLPIIVNVVRVIFTWSACF